MNVTSSATDTKNSLASRCYGPLVPPVLNLLEDAAATPPTLSFIVFNFLNLRRFDEDEVEKRFEMRKNKKEDSTETQIFFCGLCSSHLPSIKVLVPLINHSVTLSMADIFHGVSTDGRDVSVPGEHWITTTDQKQINTALLTETTVSDVDCSSFLPLVP